MSSESTHEWSDECRAALRRLESYLDGELGDLTKGRLRQHLEDCAPCTDRVGFEGQLRALVRQGCFDEAPAALRDRIRNHLDELTAT
ncbi:MAG: mycothiol system anti-sigma-R factor [Nitriliruptoraceae bacterium]